MHVCSCVRISRSTTHNFRAISLNVIFHTLYTGRHQTVLDVVRFSRSWGQRTKSRSDQENRVNGFKLQFTQIQQMGDELIRFSSSRGKQDHLATNIKNFEVMLKMKVACLL